jgi:hypothetical protein
LKLHAGKWCTRCRQWLPLDDFRPNELLRGGLDSWCRRCHRERTQQWRNENREYLERYNAKRREEYRSAHPRTSRPCVVCGKPHSRKPGALVCSEGCRSR